MSANRIAISRSLPCANSTRRRPSPGCAKGGNGGISLTAVAIDRLAGSCGARARLCRCFRSLYRSQQGHLIGGAQLAVAWPLAQGSRAGTFIVSIPGAKSRKHLEENVRAAEIVLTADDLAKIDRIVPHGAASGTRYPIGQMHRLNL